MKKIILIFVFMLFGYNTFAQPPGPPSQELVTEKVVEKKESNNSFYVSIGLSMGTNDDFKFREFTYPSIEGGYTIGDISFGAVIGRGNLVDVGKENIENYWYEGKVTLINNEGRFNPFIFLGAGNYIDQNHTFIEYGFGVGTRVGPVGVNLAASSWDTDWYISPSLSYGFN